ncbi:hypothetical protein FQN60_001574, partial [Etheostoma spectabile]
DARATAQTSRLFERNKVTLIKLVGPQLSCVTEGNRVVKFGLNGCPRALWMGCTVSFICCEDDFPQMPVHQHDEEKKKKESLKKKKKKKKKKRKKKRRSDGAELNRPERKALM